MKRIILSLLLAFSTLFMYAGEGMWIPLLLKALNEAEMQQMGMKMSAEDIYSVNDGSLKDAIVHFGGFCTGEVISHQGLVLTNHHCGYGNIQQHSTLENNLLKDGFWASSLSEEIPNPGLFVTFIVRIKDVTSEVLDGVGEGLDPAARQSAVDKNIDKALAGILRESYQSVMIRPFFHGNQYFAFVTETYNDVRLVGAPPESIGKFGADTDNWEWPRHTGDFSLFRIYADADNKPAEYSEENIPYTPKHYLPISLDGVDAGDFSMIFGFPGRTDQYLPASGVQYVAQVVDPARIAVRDRALKIMDRYMRQDEATRLNYSSKFASTANGWKKWIGETQGLERTNAIENIKHFEAEFSEKVEVHPDWNASYGHLLPAFDKLYKELAPYAEARVLYGEIFNRNIELFRAMNRLFRAQRIYKNNGEEAYREYADQQKAYFADFFAAYNVEADKEIALALLKYANEAIDNEFLPEMLRNEDLFMRGMTFEKLTDEIYAPAVATLDGVQALLSMKGDDFVKAFEQTKAYQVAVAVQQTHADKVNEKYTTITDQLRQMQRTYMKALMEVFPKRTFWPDANSTLRVTYGQIEGYAPRDAVRYQPVSYLDGVIEKYVPGDYEFDVPEKLLELYESKDYGQYADPRNGKIPVCILGSNHTSGGNSGSPAIDAYGNLIGLNFDRVWEGTMSDLYYDRSICRNIMVDIRYVLFIIDKYAGARHLIDEMTLVHPKA